MIFFRKVNLIWGIIFVFFLNSCTLLRSNELNFDGSNNGPFLVSIEKLKYSLERIQDGDSTYVDIYQNLIEHSETFLNKGPFSVTYNFMTPPSKNKHDYMSIAPYFWPNPNTSSGLPYIYKPGERNPQNTNYDYRELSNLSRSVWYLSLSYFFSKEEHYARKAAELVKAWFLKADTYMKPHLKYGQGIPGVTNGTGSGIIETLRFLRIIDGVSLIYESQHWTKQNQLALKRWFYKYLNWLLSSELGEKAEGRNNNHSTWYETQLIAYSLFVEQEEIAESRSKSIVAENINNQIRPSGKQYYELLRANALDYSVFNLQGIINILTLYKNFGINIDNKTASNAKKALDWLIPFAKGRVWSYLQEGNFNRCSLVEIYRRAAIIFDDDKYEEVAQSLIKNKCKANLSLLVYPNMKGE